MNRIFDVRFVLNALCDIAEGLNAKIVQLNDESVNKYPVYICSEYVEDAMNDLVCNNCKQPINVACLNHTLGRLYVFGCEAAGSGDLRDALICGLFDGKTRVHRFFDNAAGPPKLIEDIDAQFNPTEKRIFNISLRIDNGEMGGPIACLRNLRLANEKYRLFANFYSLNRSEMYAPLRGLTLASEDAPPIVDTEWYKDLLLSGNDLSIHYMFSQWCQYREAIDSLLWFHERLKFSEKDIFLLQDKDAVSAFYSVFGTECPNVFYVYHTQGAESSETGFSGTPVGAFLDRRQEKQLELCRNWIFPSEGAVEGFLSTATDQARATARRCNFKVAYNGYEAKAQIFPDETFVDFLNNGIPSDSAVFVSAAYLYVNKGVERIPKILSLFRNFTKRKIFWILIGDGVMRDNVADAIERHLNDGEYVWFKRRFDNQDNLFALFERSDFYIMMHRVSVFDLSTLQAMAYGCIPLLSDVGGNRELCGFDNGILTDPESVDSTLFTAISDDWIAQTKYKNKRIIRKNFNNMNFLMEYCRILERKSYW
jgi:glycosyltransferase involved in cell wall biosynthesis